MTATNANGTGAASAASSAVIPSSVPDAPTGVSATAGATSASVSFTAPFDNGSAITSYTVTATDTTTPANGGQTASGASSPITVSGLTNGDAYTFTVTATNANGTGAASVGLLGGHPVRRARRPDRRDGHGCPHVGIGRPSRRPPPTVHPSPATR